MTTDEIMVLADAYATQMIHAHYHPTDQARATLLKAVEVLAADAELWRAYKARKDAALAAGFGRSPLRKETP